MAVSKRQPPKAFIMDTQWIDKIDVVKRQIKESVRLFFEERDPVAIHTLIASAHQILFDLGKIKGIESLVKNTKALKDDKIKDFLRGINYPFNFFKHADRDPDSKINVTPLINLTEDLMLDAIILDQRINGSISFEAKIFWLWFVSKHKSSPATSSS